MQRNGARRTSPHRPGAAARRDPAGGTRSGRRAPRRRRRAGSRDRDDRRDQVLRPQGLRHGAPGVRARRDPSVHRRRADVILRARPRDAAVRRGSGWRPRAARRRASDDDDDDAGTSEPSPSRRARRRRDPARLQWIHLAPGRRHPRALRDDPRRRPASAWRSGRGTHASTSPDTGDLLPGRRAGPGPAGIAAGPAGRRRPLRRRRRPGRRDRHRTLTARRRRPLPVDARRPRATGIPGITPGQNPAEYAGHGTFVAGVVRPHGAER